MRGWIWFLVGVAVGAGAYHVARGRAQPGSEPSLGPAPSPEPRPALGGAYDASVWGPHGGAAAPLEMRLAWRVTWHLDPSGWFTLTWQHVETPDAELHVRAGRWRPLTPAPRPPGLPDEVYQRVPLDALTALPRADVELRLLDPKPGEPAVASGYLGGGDGRLRWMPMLMLREGQLVESRYTPVKPVEQVRERLEQGRFGVEPPDSTPPPKTR